MIQLSTRDVERVVASVFSVPESDMLALRARLENLRKKGCPTGLATGRGKVAKFNFEQLTDVSLALALIDAGLSPDYAVFAVEDTNGVFSECLGLLDIQELPTDELLVAIDSGEWPAGRRVVAWCSMHRLLSSPRDDFSPLATWVASDCIGSEQPVGVQMSAVRIDIGTLFVQLVKAISGVTDLVAVTLAQELLDEAGQYVVRP